MPAEHRVQEVISSLEGGIGAVLIRSFIAVIAALALLALYARSNHPGLRSAHAMEDAQLGWNIATGKGFTTACIRPADTWYLRKHAKPTNPAAGFPDIRNAPLYPATLSVGFRMLNPPPVGEPSVLHSRLELFAPEQRVVIPTTVLFTLATTLLVFLIGRRLFDPRTAFTAAITYFVSDTVLSAALSGTATPVVTFFATAAVYLSITHSRPHGTLQPARMAAIGLACGLAFLTRYPAIALLPAVAVIALARLERGRWAAAGLLVAVTALVAAPWLVRNARVSGGPLGIAPHSALHYSSDYAEDSFDRTLDPHPYNTSGIRALKNKILSRSGTLYDVDLRTLGSGIIVCFFLVSLFFRSGTSDFSCFKIGTVLAVLCLLLVAAAGNDEDAALLTIALPMVTLCGVGFFFELMHMSEALDQEWETPLTWALVLLTALPAICTLAGTRRAAPYPPYHQPLISYVAGLLEPGETICTDIPWATAWYGHRRSMLIPASVAEFVELNKTQTPIGGLYLTTETTDRRYNSELRDGAFQSWLPILNRQVPADFPFKHGIALPPDRHDQLFLTDRPRRPTEE